ncbi:MAG: NPXTG-anchored protein, partial [Clostridia bacterium]|nr:NPXTG-anchored protein [Clostridia bacterium]
TGIAAIIGLGAMIVLSGLGIVAFKRKND